MTKFHKCKICGGDYVKSSMAHSTCSPVCAIALIDARKRLNLLKEQRKIDLGRKEVLKTRSDHMKDAQTEFNKFIRLRDAKQPCISCGRVDVEWTRGGAWDCGHYLSRGAYPELRFNEANAHKQCKSCNGGSGKFAKKNKTVADSYRINLIKKIGQKMVEWIEGHHEPMKYTVEDLQKLKSYYRDQCKQLKKEAA